MFGASSYETEIKVINTQGKHGFARNIPAGQEFPTKVYPFGMDPIWFRSEEQLLSFSNNFKMKLAVIFAVI